MTNAVIDNAEIARGEIFDRRISTLHSGSVELTMDYCYCTDIMKIFIHHNRDSKKIKAY